MEDHEQIELEEHISRPNVRRTRRRSVIVSSCICISIYILGFALACALSVSYIQLLPTDKNKDRPGQLFLVSFICSNIVLLFQVLLVVLGVINIILGRRAICIKALEGLVAFLCFLLTTTISIATSLEDKDYCFKATDDCKTFEKFATIVSWVLLFLAFIEVLMNLADCFYHSACSSSSSTASTSRISHSIRSRYFDHWYDRRTLRESKDSTTNFFIV